MANELPPVAKRPHLVKAWLIFGVFLGDVCLFFNVLGVAPAKAGVSKVFKALAPLFISPCRLYAGIFVLHERVKNRDPGIFFQSFFGRKNRGSERGVEREEYLNTCGGILKCWG